MYRLLYYNNRDNRNDFAVIYHILLNCTKNNEEMPFDDFYWIINKANYWHSCKYYKSVLSYDFLVWIDEIPLCLDNFEQNWSAKYKIGRNGKIIKNRARQIIIGYENWKYTDYLSKATLTELDLAIKAWKIYGKYFVRINNIIYSIKQKIRSKKVDVNT